MNVPQEFTEMGSKTTITGLNKLSGGNYDVHCRTIRREKEWNKVVGYRRKLLKLEKLEFPLETIKE